MILIVHIKLFEEASVLGVKETNVIPDNALEALARCLLAAIRSYFESDDGQRAFAEWQAQKDTEKLPSREAKPDETVWRAGQSKARGRARSCSFAFCRFSFLLVQSSVTKRYGM